MTTMSSRMLFLQGGNFLRRCSPATALYIDLTPANGRNILKALWSIEQCHALRHVLDLNVTFRNAATSSDTVISHAALYAMA